MRTLKNDAFLACAWLAQDHLEIAKRPAFPSWLCLGRPTVVRLSFWGAQNPKDVALREASDTVDGPAEDLRIQSKAPCGASQPSTPLAKDAYPKRDSPSFVPRIPGTFTTTMHGLFQ